MLLSSLLLLLLLCWKHGNFLETNPTTDTLIMICRNYLNKYCRERYRTDTFDSCFNSWLMLRQLRESWLKWWYYYLLSGRYLRLNFKSRVVSTLEVYARLSQEPKMGILAIIIINGFKLKLITIIARTSIIDVWRGPESIKYFILHELYICFEIIKILQGCWRSRWYFEFTNVFINLPIRLKFPDQMFFLLWRAKCARPKNIASLRGFAGLSVPAQL